MVILNAKMNDEFKSRLLAMVDGEWIYAQAIEDLKTMTFQEYLLNRFKTKRYGFNHPSFDKIAFTQSQKDEYILNPYDVEEGVITCIKCGGCRVFSTVIQTRASDEPLTTVAHCVKCKTKWTQNG